MKKIIAILAALVLLCSSVSMAQTLLEMVPQPQMGSVGGEWAVIALARGDADVPEGYYEGYLDRVEDALKACGGVLHPVKRTEYSRVALALAALGENPADFRGYDLLAPLAEVDKVKMQGNNGPIWALIALDSNDYPGTEAAKAQLVSEIIAMPNEDGGFGIAPGQGSNVDMTAMALTALAKHADEAAGCIEAALGFLASAEFASSESCAQALVAYSALNMSVEAAQMREELEGYAVGGGYRHLMDENEVNGMATEQVLYAIAAYERMLNGQNVLFDMRDAK